VSQVRTWAGVSEDSALRFAWAVGLGLFNALRHSEGPPVLTLVRQGAVRLTAQVAGRRTGVPASKVECWRELWTPQLVDMVTIRSNRRRPTLRLVVAIHGGAQLEQRRRWSPPNAGHFAQLAERDIRHFT
jgi:hypothetical protein